MDRFEITIVKLRFETKNSTEWLVFLDIITYESNGMNPGEEKTQTFALEKTLGCSRHQKIFSNPDSVISRTTSDWWSPYSYENYSLDVMGPYLAMLGMQGWEVVDYKTNADPVFGQALLKRKIKKEKRKKEIQ